VGNLPYQIKNLEMVGDYLLVKCKVCGNKIDRNEAFKVIVDKKNSYYCNEKEYNELIRKQSVKDNTYEEINNIFGRKVTNTVLYKEIWDLSLIYTFEKILSYLKFNSNYLSGVMEKSFASEYAQIRYFAAILKNSLSDFKEDDSVLDKQLVVDIPKDNYKKKERKKPIIDFEMEVDEEL